MDKNKKSKSKVSRVTLRLDTATHDRLVKLARTLGLTVNGLAAYIFFRGLGPMELEAKAYQRMGGDDTDDQFEQMEEWLRENPGRTRKEFVLHLIEELMEAPYEPSQIPRLPDVTGPVTHPKP